MKKRWTAALLALVLAAALLPVNAQAAQTDRSAGSRLTGVDQAAYDTLRSEVSKITSGFRTSTVIRIPDQDALSWSLDELGASGSDRNTVMEKTKERLLQTLHMERIFTALISDCPYEMFWKGSQYTYGCDYVFTGNRAYIKNLTLSIQPSQDYAGRAEYSLDPVKVTAARQAAANARNIVNQYRDLSDYEKLNAYRQEICRLVSFESAAAADGYPYGDPWQLVSVFDGDPHTNVVCEGYAKAFKYLCDLSDFQGDVTCYLVTGGLDGGNHMWNVVRMDDGRNYLVDVTNCDSGTVGADDKLFLAGGSTSGDGQVWTISVGSSFLTYSYRAEERGLYTDGFLALSQEDFVPPAAAEPPQVTEPAGAAPGGSTFTDVAEGAYYAEAVAWAVEQGITKGTSETTFSPDRTCTVEEILMFLWRAAGRPDSGYGASGDRDKAVLWAYGMGLIHPTYSNPSGPCTRSMAVTSIWWAVGQPSPNEESGFADVPGDSSYAEAVAWAVEREITNGTSDTTFDPDGICTRGQIVTFLYRAYH